MTNDESKHKLETTILNYVLLLLLRMKYTSCWKSSWQGEGYTCSVSKYWKKEARAWMPGSTLDSTINMSISSTKMI